MDTINISRFFNGILAMISGRAGEATGEMVFSSPAQAQAFIADLEKSKLARIEVKVGNSFRNKLDLQDYRLAIVRVVRAFGDDGARQTALSVNWADLFEQEDRISVLTFPKNSTIQSSSQTQLHGGVLSNAEIGAIKQEILHELRAAIERFQRSHGDIPVAGVLISVRDPLAHQWFTTATASATNALETAISRLVAKFGSTPATDLHVRYTYDDRPLTTAPIGEGLIGIQLMPPTAQPSPRHQSDQTFVLGDEPTPWGYLSWRGLGDKVIEDTPLPLFANPTDINRAFLARTALGRDPSLGVVSDQLPLKVSREGNRLVVCGPTRSGRPQFWLLKDLSEEPIVESPTLIDEPTAEILLGGRACQLNQLTDGRVIRPVRIRLQLAGAGGNLL